MYAIMKAKKNNFLTVKQCTQTAKFCEVVRIYDMYLRSVMDNLLDFYRDEVRGKMPEINEAEHLVFDSHMHHLNSFYSANRDDVVETIKDLLIDFPKQTNDFEKLREIVSEEISGQDGAGAVVIYDIAKFIGHTFKAPIAPEKYVYLHGEVYTGAMFLDRHSNFDINKKQSKQEHNKKKKYFYIDKSEFPPCFQKLDASHIEDILCRIGHFCKDKKGSLKPTLSRSSSIIDLYIYNILRGIAGHDGKGNCQCMPCTEAGKCSAKEDNVQIWNCPCHAANCKSCKLKESLNKENYEKFN